MNDLPIIGLDEFDRITDVLTREQMTETIKSMSDHASSATIVVIGIASDVSDIISNHQSISRALKQVRMPHLSLAELESIISKRYIEAGLAWTDEALFLMAALSHGLPYYAHSMGRQAGSMACQHQHSKVDLVDVFAEFQEALKEVDQSITEAYVAATTSQRGEATLYEPVLLACALAESDVLGGFQQAAVTKPLERIVNRDPPYTPTTFAFHMNEFCEEKRGSILTKSGVDRNFRHKFADALMQPYVILQGLSTKKLSPADVLELFPQRQLDLGIAP